MSDSTQSPKQQATTYLKDYRPPAYLVDAVDLEFLLGEQDTRVSSTLRMRRNPERDESDVRLDGDELTLRSISLDGEPLDPSRYTVGEDGLTICRAPEKFELSIETEIHPRDNTALSGLYLSSGNFCTQCEAEGFRRITYFPDRPDVLSRYRVTVSANRERYPVLLSNGNLDGRGELPDGRHWARWVDPFPKPSYLFALVAGDLARVQDEFTTRSGERVELNIYTQHHNADKCGHAMRSLQRAMRWDEEVYGREYDLALYNIVVVDDFNMGAMENKSLNVFNSQFVLAKPETATDDDYIGVESVIGHEYFHNWSGNRVTCRDWFQLSLKEGFTVFRDQEFSADMGSRGVKRIRDVQLLRAQQFLEDSGPMAHPVRPESYREINNFYTRTVYEKGAEVVRMLHHILGAGRFRAGTDLYFQRHDGQAVTTDDFVAALEDASGEDLTQFKRWYRQAGTPELQVEEDYDAEHDRFALRIMQSCPNTPGQTDKRPFHIPLAVRLYAADGQPLGEQSVLNLRRWQQDFTFDNVPERPVVSLHRGFSAPVKVQYRQHDAALYALMAHDDDPFARWEAGQKRFLAILLELAEKPERAEWQADPGLIDTLRAVIGAADTDSALIAEMLGLPPLHYLEQFMSPVDPAALHSARTRLRHRLAVSLQDEFSACYRAHRDHGDYSLLATAMARRALKNACLRYLVATQRPDEYRLAVDQYRGADNMTDSIAALGALVESHYSDVDELIRDFYVRWREEPLVVDKWLSLQARSDRPGAVERVDALLAHEAFSITNPNKVRALIGAFAGGNPAGFHDVSGDGYRWVADRVLQLDPLNPQIAARISGAFNHWRRLEPRRSQLMRAEIDRILRAESLSRDVREIVEKAVA